MNLLKTRLTALRLVLGKDKSTGMPPLASASSSGRVNSEEGKDGKAGKPAHEGKGADDETGGKGKDAKDETGGKGKMQRMRQVEKTKMQRMRQVEKTKMQRMRQMEKAKKMMTKMERGKMPKAKVMMRKMEKARMEKAKVMMIRMDRVKLMMTKMWTAKTSMGKAKVMKAYMTRQKGPGSAWKMAEKSMLSLSLPMTRSGHQEKRRCRSFMLQPFGQNWRSGFNLVVSS